VERGLEKKVELDITHKKTAEKDNPLSRFFLSVQVWYGKTAYL
jgi:hypothetical protein